MTYYQQIRKEIRPLLPTNVTRILDVGAGAGATLGWLRTIYPNAETTGVEINPGLLSDLKKHADVAIIGDVDESLSRLGTYDLILVLDVLEHLVDSVGTLRKLSQLLEPNGQVIVSVPNIAHFSVVVPLLLKRRFAYQDAGILDRTHLRFFVEDTAIKLLNDANFVVTEGLVSGLQGPKSRTLDRISFGLLRHYLAKQYLMLGRLLEPADIQQIIRWGIAE